MLKILPISFLPETESSADWKGSSNSGSKGISGSLNPRKSATKTILIVLAIIIIIALLGILIYYLKNRKNNGPSYKPESPVKAVSSMPRISSNTDQNFVKGSYKVSPVNYSP